MKRNPVDSSICILIHASLLLALATAVFGQESSVFHKTDDSLLFKMQDESSNNIEWFIASRGYQRFACMVIGAKKESVILDGITKSEYDHIDTMLFSSDGSHFACIGGIGPRFFINLNLKPSSNELKLSKGVPKRERALFGSLSVIKDYVNEMKTAGLPADFDQSKILDTTLKYVVNYDGHELKRYDYIGIKNLFNSTGEHIVYFSRDSLGEYIVFDTLESKQSIKIMNSPRFAPEGKLFGYSAKDSEDKFVVVGDNRSIKSVGTSADSPIFSKDGRHYAYALCMERSNARDLWLLCMDNQIVDTSNGFMYDSPIFSPDGKRTAYGCVKDGGTFHIYVDRQDIGTCIALFPGPIFSPNSLHYAYWGAVGRPEDPKCFFRIDTLTTFVQDGRMVRKGWFSPDSKRFGYISCDFRNKYFTLTLDSLTIGSFASIDTLIFSQDSKHFAILCKDESTSEECIVFDGTRQTNYDRILTSSISLSPNGEHIGYLASAFKKWVLVIDGNVIDTFEDIALGGGTLFDSDSSYRLIAKRDDNIIWARGLKE